MTKVLPIILSIILASSLLMSPPISAESNVKKLPVDAFATLPFIRTMSISPDGKKLVVVRATTNNGDYIIEIRDTKNLQKEPVRLGADKMLVSNVFWLNNKRIAVMFRQILKDGARSYWVNKFAITDVDGKGSWLVPFKENKNANFSIIDILPNNKEEVLVEVDINDNWIPDVVRMNIDTGRTITVMRGNTKIQGGFISDSDGEIRAATGWNSSNQSIDMYVRAKGSDEWKVMYQNSPSNREEFNFEGFSKADPNKVYINANLGEDKTGIYLYDIKTKSYSERLFGLKTIDTDGVVFNKWGDLLGYSYTTKFPQRYYENKTEQQLHDSISALFEEKSVRIASRSDDDNMIVIHTSSPKDPGSYYLLRDRVKLEVLGVSHPKLKPEDLSTVKYITYKARDGRKIKAYLTIPKGEGKHPAVVLPHGGPWVRDRVIYDEWAQFLAHNGYLVIQPQYRGSKGYGLEHWKAGDNKWGLEMQDDLDDAALFLVEKGLADKDKLALFGWSYGGYAGFVASMRENNIYQCSVAGAGVSNLGRISATLNSNRFLRELQRPTITGLNPVEHIDKVNIPILVIHGDIDVRVPVKHSTEFVDGLQKHNKDHKYIELEDADHFSDTLFYDHKKLFYSELLSWLDNKCGLKN